LDTINETENRSGGISPVLIQLLKGVLYEDLRPDLWRDLFTFRAAVSDYFDRIGLMLFIDETEGYAFLRQQEESEEEAVRETNEALPRLVPRRQLSYPLSLLLVLLRKKMVEQDAGGGQTRLILTREQIIDMIQVFLPEAGNEARLIEQIDSHINRVVEYGFLRRLKGEESRFEVRRIVKALVDADWLTDLNDKLTEYRNYGAA